MSVLPIPQIDGVPDRLIEVLNERLRSLQSSGSTSTQGSKGTSVPVSSDGVSGATMGAITYSLTGDGFWTWGIDHVTWTNPTNANLKQVILTVQKTDENGNPADFIVDTEIPDPEGAEREAVGYAGSGTSVDHVITGWGIPPQKKANRANNPYVWFTFKLYAEDNDGNRRVQKWDDGALFQRRKPLEQAASIGGNRIRTGAGLGVDANGNLIFKYTDQFGVTTNGEIILAVGSIDMVNLSAEVQSALSDSGSLSIVYGLPALPNANYPVGSMISNLADGLVYVNVGNTWTFRYRPQDMLAGTLAAGVVYAGAINAAQINAGKMNIGFLEGWSGSNIYVGSGLTFTGSGWSTTINSTGVVASTGVQAPIVGASTVVTTDIRQGGVPSPCWSIDRYGSASLISCTATNVYGGIIYENGSTLSSKYAAANHDHNSLYYTKAEVNALLAQKAPKGTTGGITYKGADDGDYPLNWTDGSIMS